MSDIILQEDSGDPNINNPDFDNGKNKRKAIASAGQALSIATRLVQDDRERDIMRARVLAAFNGEPPYSDGALRAKAQAYRYNVSFGFMEGVIGRAVVPYNELTLNVDDLAQIDADLPDHKLNIMREEFAKAIKNHGKWPKFITRLNQDLVLNGYNNALFPSDYDFFPVFIPQKEGFVHDGTLNDVEDLDVFVWKHDYLVHELYNKIEDEEIADKAGWNIKNVRSALMQAAPKNLTTSNPNGSGSWMAVEEAIRGGSIFNSIIGAKVVEAFHVFASELDGTVTHYIVLANGTVDNKFSSDSDVVELFKKERRFGSFSEILVYFDVETGDGNWHGSRGVGRRVFNTHKAIDKLRCSVLDQAFVSGLTILQPGDQASQEDFQLAVIGPFAVIPAGISIAATTLPAISQTTFSVDNLLSATSEQRIGDVVPEAGSTLGLGSKTATEARISANRQALIGKGNLERYLNPLSEVLSIMIRRLLKKESQNSYAKKFQEDLLKRGLTEEDFMKVRGARSSGRIDDVLGEAQAKTQTVFAEFRNDPDIDQKELKLDRITSIIGAKAAERLMINGEDQTKVIEAQRLQELENTTLQTGVPVPVSARDFHEAHLDIGLQFIGSEVQKQAHQFNEQAIPILKLATAHAGMHLGFLQQDKVKKQIFDKYKSRVSDSVNAIKDLEKQGIQLANASFQQAAKIARTPEEKAQVQQAQQQLQSHPK